jgi:hypothetical protein
MLQPIFLVRRVIRQPEIYDYVDENNSKQIIHFDVVAVDTTIQTYAKGKIPITENFTLSPSYVFTGDVLLTAANQYLTFDGAAKIAHECTALGNYWLKFNSEINPKQIYIPVSLAPIDINNNNLVNGIMLTPDTADLYSAFLTKPKNYNDFPVFTAEGFLFYDKSAKKYKISNKEKLVEINMPGNYLTLHKEFCDVYAEGKFDYGADLGQVKLGNIGNVTYNPTKVQYFFDQLMTIDFFFHENALKFLSEALNNDVTLEPVTFSRPTYEKGILEILGKEESEKLKSEIGTYGSFRRLPKEFEHTMFLTDLKMKWNKDLKMFVSEGKIGIGNILKTQVNKMVDGYVAIQMKRSEKILYLYFKIDEANWYYFQYRSGIMSAVSSNADFMTSIRELKVDKRKLEVEKGQKPYSFYITTETTKTRFLKTIESGVSEEEEGEEEEGRRGRKDDE